MRINKQLGIRIFLGVESIVFAFFYLLGSNGIMALLSLKKDISNVRAHVIALKEDIGSLQSTLALQKEHPFFQEKIAREQLQMARAEEEIYLYDNMS
jgi:cell division protein FtsB